MRSILYRTFDSSFFHISLHFRIIIVYNCNPIDSALLKHCLVLLVNGRDAMTFYEQAFVYWKENKFCKYHISSQQAFTSCLDKKHQKESSRNKDTVHGWEKFRSSRASFPCAVERVITEALLEGIRVLTS